MLEVFESDRGQALLAAVGEVAQAHFLPDLEAGSLGGGAAAVDIALLGPTGWACHVPMRIWWVTHPSRMKPTCGAMSSLPSRQARRTCSSCRRAG